MTYLIRCISAELLKIRRTNYLLGAVALPTILSLLNFILILMLDTSRDKEYASEGGWLSFAHNTITFWPLIVLPCVIVLVTAFSAHQEHGTKRWRTLMCLPVPKPALYLAKLAVAAGLCLFSCVVLWGENILWGWLFSLLRPEAGLSLARLNPLGLFIPFLFAFLYSLLLLAIQFWFSMWVQRFSLTVGVGFFLSLVGAFMHDEAIWRLVFPWSLPSLARSASGWQEGVIGLLYSIAGFAVVVCLGCQSFARRDVLE